MAKLQYLLRRASTYLNISRNGSKTKELSDGEVVYCKNNVCVHSFDKHSNDLIHNFGYLTVKCSHYNNCNNNQLKEESDEHKWTLCLEWTSNQTLTKRLELNCDLNNDCDLENNRFIYNDSQNKTNYRNSLQSLNNLSLNLSTNNDKKSLSIKIETFDDNGCDAVCDDSIITNNNNNNVHNSSHDINKTKYDLIKSLTTISSPISQVRRCQSCRTTPIKRYPSNEGSIATFSVDLKQIKSLRLFFCDEYSDYCDISNSSSDSHTRDGQLVIVSRDNFYKVFHFHTGGLDKLSHVLNEWDFFDKSDSSKETNYLQFSICRPQLKTEECHPEEKLYVSIDETQWKNSINEFGQIINESNLRKTIFFAGIEPSLRKEIWPFLLHRYEFNSTYAERESDDSDKSQLYYQIHKRFDSMDENEKELFWRNVQSIVEKDVVRTDRSNPFFAGDNNDNIEKMKRILINFGLYCPSMGYTQGMSDLLAPLLSEMKCEDQTFWCFAGMMQFTNFVSSPKDTDMDHNLVFIRFNSILLILMNYSALLIWFNSYIKCLFVRHYFVNSYV
jgi:hypothetical protein